MNFDLTRRAAAPRRHPQALPGQRVHLRRAGQDRGLAHRLERGRCGRPSPRWGCSACRFAEEHGGFGGTAVDVMLVMEAIGEGLVVEPYWVNVGLGGRLVARGGSEAQQKRILPALIQGKHRLAFAHTERGARYDLAPRRARAPSAAGDGFALDGEKRAVLHGGRADTLVVSARTAGGDTDAARHQPLPGRPRRAGRDRQGVPHDRRAARRRRLARRRGGARRRAARARGPRRCR